MSNSNAQLNAFDLYARLQGIDTSKIVSSRDDVEDILDDIDNIDESDLTEEKAQKVKTDKKGEKKRKPKAEEKKPVAMETVPDLKEFSRLKRDLTIEVEQKTHDIKYKEQNWNIPERSIIYNVEIVKQPKIAKNLAIRFSGNSNAKLVNVELARAVQGKVRYFRIVSYENIPYKSKEIGYIKVWIEENKYKSRMILEKENMKNNNIDPDKVSKKVQNMLISLLGRDEKKEDKK